MAKVTPKKGSLSVDFKPTPQSVLADVERQEAILSAMEGTGAFPEQTQPEIPEQDQPLPDLSGSWVTDPSFLSDPASKYLAKPTFTALQWVFDKFLTGEQVTGAAYRHYQQTRPDRDKTLYPEQEFTSYGDAMKKGLIHKTEWDWTDIARTEDWYGKTYMGQRLHQNISAFQQIVDGGDEYTPDQKQDAFKAVKRAKRDLNWGNTITGLFTGIAADPLTYVGTGAAKAVGGLAKTPTAKLHQTLLLKIASYSKVSSRVDEIKKLVFTGGKAYKIKVIEGFSESVQTLRKAGFTEDVIKGIDDGSVLIDDIIPTLKPTVTEYDDIVSALKNIDALREISDGMAAGEGRLLSKKFLTTHRLQDAWAAHQKLGRSEKGRAVLDLFETAAVEKIDGTYGLGTGFYQTLKNAGLGDDAISEILARNRGFQSVIDPTDGAIKQTIDMLDKAPLAHEMDEFNAGVEAALNHIDPKLQPLAKQYRILHKDIADELIKRDIMTRDIMENFARELGMSHLRHFPKYRYWEFIKKAAVAKRHSLLEDSRKALTRYAGDLKRAGIPSDDIVKAINAAKADIKKMMNAKRGTEQLVNADDLLKNFFGQARAIHEAYPDIAMGSIIKRFKASLKDVRGFRSVMGTVNEIDDLAVNAGFKKVIETNAAEIMFKQEMLARRAIAYHDYIERIIKNYPDAVARYSDGMDTAGKTLVEDAFMGKYLVSDEFANTFKLILGMETGTGDTWNTYFKWFDWMQEKWRYYTLIPFAKFHTRNLFSEEYLNTLGGMNMADPAWIRSHKKASTLAMDALVKKDPGALEAYAHLMEQGTLGHGFFGAELGTGQNLTRGGQPFPFLGREYSMPFSVRNAPVIGRKLLPIAERAGEMRESIPRLAMYYYGLEKGPQWVAKRGGVKLGRRGAQELTEEMSETLAKGLQKYGLPQTSPDGLVAYTRKFHPTYDKFTPLEQQYFRRAMPFYSWPRFNIPLHFQMMVENPRAYAQIERGRRFITRMRDAKLPDKDAPAYIKEGYAVGWSKEGSRETYQLMKNWLPPIDIDDVMGIRPLAKKMMQMFTPIVKTPMEVLLQRDTFRGKSLPSYPGAKTVIGGIPGTDKTIKIGQRTAHLLQPIRVLQEWNKFWWGRHDSFWDAAIGHVIGRKYDVDMNMARRHLYYQFNEIVNGKPGVNAQGQETGLKAGRRIAVKNKDWDTVKKLDRNIAEFEREMARLKPYVIKKKQTGKRTRRRIR